MVDRLPAVLASTLALALVLTSHAGAKGTDSAPPSQPRDTTTSAQALEAVQAVVAAGAGRCRLLNVTFSVGSLTRWGYPVSFSAERRGAAPTDPRANGRFYVPYGKVEASDPWSGRVKRGCTRDDVGGPGDKWAWRSLPYLNFDSGELRINSDARFFRGGKRNKRLQSALGTSGAVAFADGRRDVMWRGGCQKSKQVAALSRVVYLPGAPGAPVVAQARATALRLFKGTSLANVETQNVFRRVEIRVNGRRVAKARNFATAQVPPSRWKAGRNEVEIRAVKRRTKRCNRGRFGLQLGVEGTFHEGGGSVSQSPRYYADVDVASPAAVPLDGNKLRLDFLIEQKGPSAWPAGEFQTSIGFSGDIKMLIQRVSSARGGIDCTVSGANDGSNGGETVVCDLPLIGAGKTVALSVTVVLKPPPGSFRERATISWAAFGWNDFTGSSAGQIQGSICSADQAPCEAP